MTPEQLADALGQSVSTVRRIERGDGELKIAQVNALTAALPLSAEELLRAMGYHLSPPASSRIPRPLLEELLARGPEEWDALLTLLQGTPPLARARRQRAS